MNKRKGVLLEAGAIDHGDISFAEINELVDLTIYENTTEENKYEHIGDAEVVFVNKVIMDEELFATCPNIKYVGVCATGYNVVDLDAARKRGNTTAIMERPLIIVGRTLVGLAALIAGIADAVALLCLRHLGARGA